jgi:hypothetical protein
MQCITGGHFVQKSTFAGTCWIILCGFALGSQVHAQGKTQASSSSQPQSCALRGTIYDPSGAVIRNAQVTISKPDEIAQTQPSSAAGRYCFPSLPVGDVTLSVSADGFATSGQQLTAGSLKPAVVDVHLGIEIQQVQLDVSERLGGSDRSKPERRRDRPQRQCRG